MPPIAQVPPIGHTAYRTAELEGARRAATQGVDWLDASSDPEYALSRSARQILAREAQRPVPVDVAADLLGLTRAALFEKANEEGWATYCLDGVTFVSADRVASAAVRCGVDVFTTAAAAHDFALTLTLREFLAANPATGYFPEAHGSRRPLICARRGPKYQWREGGIEHHTVALDRLWLTHYAGHLGDDRTDAEAKFIRRWMPVGDKALQDSLNRVDGIARITAVTPLSRSFASTVSGLHRVSTWVRIDATLFPPVVEEPWLFEVTNPWADPLADR